MSKEERELRMQIEQLKTDARQLVSENKIAEAKVKTEKMKDLIEKADLLAELEDDGTAGQPLKGEGEVKDEKELKEQYSKTFFKNFRRKKLSAADHGIIEAHYKQINDALSETGGDPEGADGGLLLPQDVETRINTFKRTLSQLEPFINVEQTRMLKGSRVYEKAADMTPLALITDKTADIAESDNPNFQPVNYTIKDYAGWLPIPNDLLDDSDQNIIAYLTKWMGKKSVVTRNSLILAIMQALEPETLDDYGGIIRMIDVDLDDMLAANASIVTNQWGFLYLDTLKDLNDRPLLVPDITQPGKYIFKGKPVIKIANSAMPLVAETEQGEETFAPFFIGNGQEFITMFERQGYQIDTTNIGGQAWRKNRTELRMIEREDVVEVDDSAIIYGLIDVSDLMPQA